MSVKVLEYNIRLLPVVYKKQILEGMSFPEGQIRHCIKNEEDIEFSIVLKDNKFVAWSAIHLPSGLIMSWTDQTCRQQGLSYASIRPLLKHGKQFIVCDKILFKVVLSFINNVQLVRW
jgi:hypothetical protein